MANIPFPDCAKDGVADGVHQDIGIRMAVQSLLVGDFHPPEDEGA